MSRQILGNLGEAGSNPDRFTDLFVQTKGAKFQDQASPTIARGPDQAEPFLRQTRCNRGRPLRSTSRSLFCDKQAFPAEGETCAP
jgi:hypothetical protein